MRATLLLRNLARAASRNGTAAARAAAPQSWRRLATSPLATDAVNLDLSQAKALTCHNMMCEHVGEPCGCRIAAFLERRSFPKLETLSLRGAGLRAVPDAVLRLPLLRELDLSRNELLRALPDDLAALESLETLDVTETALEALPPRLFDLPRLRRVAAGAELLVAPAGWTAADGALERCVVVAAAASSRVRPPVAAPRRRAFGTSAAQAAQNSADVRDLLRTRLSLTEADLDRVERFQPAGARATVEPKLGWFQTRLELDAVQLRKIVVRHPALLLRSVESMESNCDWLQTRLGLDEAHLRKMVLRLPPLLYLSVEENLAPTLEWLQRRLDLDDAGLRKVVLQLPPVLGYSVEANIAPTLDWLQTRLDLDAAQLKRVVLGRPALLGYSVEDNMAPKLNWLQSRLDLDDAGLMKIVLTLPGLLGYSVDDNMAPKLAYLEREIGLSRAELRDWVVTTPSLLGYSLASRYRPRLEACCAAGVDVRRVLSYATQTDETFYARLERLEEKRAQMY